MLCQGLHERDICIGPQYRADDQGFGQSAIFQGKAHHACFTIKQQRACDATRSTTRQRKSFAQGNGLQSRDENIVGCKPDVGRYGGGEGDFH